jgi:hypothetical protein
MGKFEEYQTCAIRTTAGASVSDIMSKQAKQIIDTTAGFVGAIEVKDFTDDDRKGLVCHNVDLVIITLDPTGMYAVTEYGEYYGKQVLEEEDIVKSCYSMSCIDRSSYGPCADNLVRLIKVLMNEDKSFALRFKEKCTGCDECKDEPDES